MDEQTLRSELNKAMAPYREKTFSQLEQLLNEAPRATVQIGSESTPCTIEVMWADFKPGLITVFGSARKQSKSFMRWFPFLSSNVIETFTVSPDGMIVDEESI